MHSTGPIASRLAEPRAGADRAGQVHRPKAAKRSAKSVCGTLVAHSNSQSRDRQSTQYESRENDRLERLTFFGRDMRRTSGLPNAERSRDSQVEIGPIPPL